MSRRASQEYEFNVWQPDLSVGQLSDNVATLNLPLIGALEVINAQVGTHRRTRLVLDHLTKLIEG